MWDLSLRLAGQLRIVPGAVIGFDMGVALQMARALGVAEVTVIEMLPEIEAKMVARLNEAGAE